MQQNKTEGRAHVHYKNPKKSADPTRKHTHAQKKKIGNKNAGVRYRYGGVEGGNGTLSHGVREAADPEWLNITEHVLPPRMAVCCPLLVWAFRCFGACVECCLVRRGYGGLEISTVWWFSILNRDVCVGQVVQVSLDLFSVSCLGTYVCLMGDGFVCFGWGYGSWKFWWCDSFREWSDCTSIYSIYDTFLKVEFIRLWNCVVLCSLRTMYVYLTRNDWNCRKNLILRLGWVEINWVPTHVHSSNYTYESALLKFFKTKRVYNLNFYLIFKFPIFSLVDNNWSIKLKKKPIKLNRWHFKDNE